MTNQNTLKNRQLDDQLAEFTDQLLDQKIPMDLSEMDSQDQTMLELQKTVMRLAQAFGDEPIDETIAQRIKSNLASEWQKFGEKAPKEPLWQRWWLVNLVQLPIRVSVIFTQAGGIQLQASGRI